jgi:hypothetical protein
MAFELLLAPGRHDQVGDLRRQEAPQPAHALDLTHLVSDTLLKLMVQLLYLIRSLPQLL